MNRQFKFRIWDKELGTFMSPNVHSFRKFPNDVGSIVLNEDIKKLAGEDRFVIQQWTGLKDKNGVDIYEGDFINRHRITKQVFFISGDDCDFQGFDLEQVFGKWEVVGNIFENPEEIR